MAAPSTCVCAQPDELPDMTCGACHLRRLGDDLNHEQFADLVRGLWLTLVTPSHPEAKMRRRGGRMGPRALRRIGD